MAAAVDDVKYRTEDASNNNVTGKQSRQFTKKPEVDLSFENLAYTVHGFDKFKRGTWTVGFLRIPVITANARFGVRVSETSGSVYGFDCYKLSAFSVIGGEIVSGFSRIFFLSIKSSDSSLSLSVSKTEPEYVQ